MQQKCIILLSILILFCFNFNIIKTSEDIPEITLTPQDNEIEIEISANNSYNLFYVNGEINDTKKYLLITLTSEKINPSLFITKNKEFDIYKQVYDYTLLPSEQKLALPSSYFEFNNITGFYISISFENESEDSTNFKLKFEYLDEITLEIGEEFSFLAKNEDVEDFKININNKIDEFKLNSTTGNIGFILSGGDEKQLSMTVNENKAKQMLNNVFGYWLKDDLDNYSININVSKNVKFFFKTKYFTDSIIDDNGL